MFRLPQNGRSRCTESSNFSGEKISFSSTAAKTRRSVCVAASAPVAERSVKLKGLVTHRFHKAQVYCVNSYSDPVE